MSASITPPQLGQTILLEAAVAELKRGGYSGVILTQAHRDIANPIVGKGITDAFRQVPHAAVWMIDAALER